MFHITGTGISFGYEDSARKILEGIDLSLDDRSKVGLIGRNGCGKTTLFRILLGKLGGFDGTLTVPDGLRTGYLPQEVSTEGYDTPEDYIRSVDPILFNVWKGLEMIGKEPSVSTDSDAVRLLSDYEELGGYAFDIELDKLLGKFGMDSSDIERPLTTLSGGERTKAALIRILLTDPDILFLDEPTNHLDTVQLDWLEKFLGSIRVPFLAISHDRKFLDNTVDQIWEIEKGELKKYTGNYTFYKIEKDNEFRRKMSLFETQQKKIKQLKKAQGQRKEWAKSYQGETGAEGRGHTYEDITNLGKKAMKRAKNVEKRIDMMIDKEEAKRPFVEKERHISFSDAGVRSRNVLTVDGLTASYGERILFEGLSFGVKTGDRLAVSGRNGSGKSTLLRILNGIIDQTAGKYRWSPQTVIGYYAQDSDELDGNATVIEEVTGGNMRDQTRARVILGSLNIRGDDVNKNISSLSPGERAKTSLARIIFSDANVLILDEPVNHLEISAREALEEALEEYTGTVIFVSHDRYFTERLASKEIIL